MGQRNITAVEVTQKQKQVFDLVVEGKSFRAIADELQMSRSTAQRYFQAALDELKVPEAKIQEWRILVSQRLDFVVAPLLQAIKDHLTEGKPNLSIRDLSDAARSVARVEDRRAKMLGIDKPTKIDVTHHIPALDPEEAAKRQQRRLKDAGFLKLSTAPPKIIDVESNGDGTGDSQEK